MALTGNANSLIFKKYLKECIFEGSYVKGYLDGEENLEKFLKDFEAVAHTSFSVVKSEKRTESSKRFTAQGKLTIVVRNTFLNYPRVIFPYTENRILYF